MKKIKELYFKLLNNYSDKLLHFLVNAIIVLAFSYINVILAVVVACIISIFKEIYDKYKSSSTGFDVKDLIADLTGIVTSLIYLLIINYLK